MRIIRPLIFLLVMTAIILTAGYAIRQASEISHREGLHAIDNPGTTAVSAVSGLLPGAFRGIAADMLFLRLIHLQESGNFWEMNQLATWITSLQPRFGGAAAFLAWNMAYNLSNTSPDPATRWRWVEAAISLLLHEAIPANAIAPEPWFELGWIHLHKIGGNTDAAQCYLKAQFAIQMEEVLRFGPMDILDVQSGFDPYTMDCLDSEYGAFDWRLPEAAALQFATHGLTFMRNQASPILERLKVMSLSESIKSGRLAWRDSYNTLAVPAPERIEPILRTIRQHLGTEGDAFWMFYHTALHDATIAASAVFPDSARAYYHELYTEFNTGEYPDTMEEFIRMTLAKPAEALSRPNIILHIDTLLRSNHADSARALHADWQRLATESGTLGMNALPPFEIFLKSY